MAFDTVALTIEGATATLTLARPAAGNALSAQSGRDLRAALVEVASAANLRLLVIRAEGRAFCVGGDLVDFATGGPLAPRVLDMVFDFHAFCALLSAIDVPILTVIQGPVAGAGLAMVLLSDYCIAARGATFTYAYPGVGFSADGGLTWLLPKAMGLQRFRRFALQGRSLTADEAVESGLLCEAVQDDDLAARAAELERSLATGPTRAFGAIRRLVIDGYDGPYGAHLLREMEEITALAAGSDAPAAIAAVLGRKAPQFQGL